MTLNSHMNKYDDHPTSFKTKWLIEGTASSFDYLYIEQYYSQNKFSSNQTIVDSAATQNPSIFENYGNDNKDIKWCLILISGFGISKRIAISRAF